MKENRGFTLIELLAVIVILAIIALIATPIVLNLIEQARQGAAKSNVYGYVDATEKAVMSALVDDTTNKNYSGTYTLNASNAANLINGTTAGNDLTIKMKGALPDNGVTGAQVVIGDNGEVTTAKLRYNGKYCVTYTYQNNTTTATIKSASNCDFS